MRSASVIAPDMGYLFRGVLIGLLFGVPAGAVGAMTAQRAYSSGLRAGLLTGLGSSVADCVYACIGAFGLSIISDFLLAHQTVINLLGGAIILVMGLGLLLKKSAPDTQEVQPVQGVKLFLSSFAVGITNPSAILTFLFAFSWFGLGGGMAPLEGFLPASLPVGAHFMDNIIHGKRKLPGMNTQLQPMIQILIWVAFRGIGRQIKCPNLRFVPFQPSAHKLAVMHTQIVHDKEYFSLGFCNQTAHEFDQFLLIHRITVNHGTC